MKRTLTAAATLLVGTAGAAGFVGTANAEAPSNSPVAAENTSLDEAVHHAIGALNTDNTEQQTAQHVTGVPHNTINTVGEIAPAAKPVTDEVANEIVPQADGGPRSAKEDPLVATGGAGTPGEQGIPQQTGQQQDMTPEQVMGVLGEVSKPAQDFVGQVFDAATPEAPKAAPAGSELGNTVDAVADFVESTGLTNGS